MKQTSLNELSHNFIGATFEVHREPGPGLLESSCEGAYARELSLRDISPVHQKSLPVLYKGVSELVDGIEPISFGALNLSAPFATSALKS